MKKLYNYTFKLVCLYIMTLSLFSLFYVEVRVKHSTRNIQNINKEKIINSSLFIPDYALVSKLEESIEENKKTENKEEIINDSKINEENTQSKEKEVINIIDTSNYAVLSNEIVNVSHYGHDCYGCTTGYTASGYYVGDGRIYYQDPTFGSVRIVAADSKYPLGTVIRLDYNNQKTAAIVLDRGGNIGDGKKFQIDLLASSNNEAYNLGIITGTTLEVLRIGY